MSGYAVTELSDQERQQLERVYTDLQALAGCEVPSVRSAARAALALIAQAGNGQGLSYDLYTASLPE